MTYDEVIKIGKTHLVPLISDLYGLQDYKINLIGEHAGGRNIAYACEKAGNSAKIIRITFLNDRNREDLLAEAEYIRHLFEHGGSVSDVVASRNENLLEEISYQNHTFFVCLFKKAKGNKLSENDYQYREGAPISEYYYNCGKTLGKLHQISKGYAPTRRRHNFFDKFNARYIHDLVPDSFPLLKRKLTELLGTLEQLGREPESFGMIHLDYNDGNYLIDFDTGEITVYDFDNSCFGWYMFDLASVWANGTGWAQDEPDAEKRKEFMDDYFKTVLDGYKSETKIEDSILIQLPLFVQAYLMENILDQFEDMKNNDETSKCDEDLSRLIMCMENDIPYLGFFHESYSC